MTDIPVAENFVASVFCKSGIFDDLFPALAAKVSNSSALPAAWLRQIPALYRTMGVNGPCILLVPPCSKTLQE